jgi:RHS repeat-associated protein
MSADFANDSPAGNESKRAVRTTSQVSDAETFAYNLRFPGQYFMAETGLNQNVSRDYDPPTGRYVESDLIGLKGGINTYVYTVDNPITYIDTTGLDVQFCCRSVDFPLNLLGYHHCYFKLNGTNYSLFPQFVFAYNIGVLGVPMPGNGRDGGGKCAGCKGKRPCTDPAKCVMDASNAYPVGAYGGLSDNSNTYAGSIARKCCDGGVPSGLGYAPGINDLPPLGFNP